MSGLGLAQQGFTASARQANTLVDAHLPHEHLDAIEETFAAGERARVDHDEGLADARPVALVDEER